MTSDILAYRPVDRQRPRNNKTRAVDRQRQAPMEAGKRSAPMAAHATMDTMTNNVFYAVRAKVLYVGHPRQHSHSRFRVLWNSEPRMTAPAGTSSNC
jgi:hypothetical protein